MRNSERCSKLRGSKDAVTKHVLTLPLTVQQTACHEPFHFSKPI